jgi:tRNA G26 N,N-dimethylase Trm1
VFLLSRIKCQLYFFSFGVEKYHAKGGPLYVGKLKYNDLANHFVNAAKELGYNESDPNSEQTEGNVLKK